MERLRIATRSLNCAAMGYSIQQNTEAQASIIWWQREILQVPKLRANASTQVAAIVTIIFDTSWTKEIQLALKCALPISARHNARAMYITSLPAMRRSTNRTGISLST